MTISEERLREFEALVIAYGDARVAAANGSRETWPADSARMDRSFDAVVLSLRSDAHTNGEVKALEWKGKNPIRDNGDLRAHSVVGMYEIGKVAGRVMVMLRCVKRGDADDIDIGSFDTFDEAKAAAQADFEARIRSALSLGHPIQGEAEPAAWLARDHSLGPKVTLMKRVAEIWAGQRLTVEPLFASPQPPTPAGVMEITDEDLAAIVDGYEAARGWMIQTEPALSKAVKGLEIARRIAASMGAAS